MRRGGRSHHYLPVCLRRPGRRRSFSHAAGHRRRSHWRHLAARRFRHRDRFVNRSVCGCHVEQWPGDDGGPGHGVRHLPGRRDPGRDDPERSGRPAPDPETPMKPQDITALAPQTPVILEMRHISKSFGAVTALVDVSIKLRQGEVLALVGDNGAGKSTLIKILSGFHQPDAGTIVSNGKPIQFSSPREARAQGIETVYQDLAMIGDLSVYHNMFLGREYHKRFFGLKLLDNAKMRALAQ